MSDLIRLTTRQTSIFNGYTVGTCEPNCINQITSINSCGSNWRWDETPCFNGKCEPIAKCSELDPNTCPHLPGGVVDSSWSTNQPKPLVDCFYDPSKFTTPEDIQAWLAAGGSQAQVNNFILPNYCFQTSTNCPPGQQTCSNMLDQGTDGEMCREWSQQHTGLYDKGIVNYCSTQPSDSQECSCVNREENRVYHQIIPSLPPETSPACWFKPCKNTGTTLIPNSYRFPECSSIVCATVRDQLETIGMKGDQETQNLISCQENPSTERVVLGYHSGIFWIVFLVIITGILIGFLIWKGIKERRC